MKKSTTMILVALMLVALLVPAVPVGAQGPSCGDEADLGIFTVSFLGKTDNPDGTSTWTYAVTSDNVPGSEGSPALSHWDLGLCYPAIESVSPGHGETYTTIGSYGVTVGREGIDYTVEIGLDPHTGIRGIKFENGDPNLGEDGKEETDIFQFTLDKHYDTECVPVGTKAGGEVNQGYILGPACSTTAIILDSFTAQASAGSVTLVWETATEANAGFNLYRAMLKDGPYTQINDALIPAQSDAASGASYSFVDTPDYGTFYYKLEDVDLYGMSAVHGPVKATLARPLRRPLYRPRLPEF
jgi:hypothetical protein